MSTRSRIGIIKPDGTIASIYCHYDGYLENNGKILFEHYQDYDKIQSLIELGNISYLAENVAPIDGIEHSFDNAQDGVVVAYMRDRGETNGAATISSGIREFAEICNNSWSEFAYLYSVENETWKWADYEMIKRMVYGGLQDDLEERKIIEPQPVKNNNLYKTAFIGMLKSDGSIKGIHSIFDGYPEWTGKRLYENFHEEKAIDTLIEMGNIKSLDHLDDTRGLVKENYDFINIDKLTEHCKTCSVNFTYLYHEQESKWFIYERQNQQAITIEPLQQYLEGIHIIGDREIQENTGINPVTYPEELYNKYPDNFGDLGAVYFLIHKMRQRASMSNEIVGHGNICILLDEFCDNGQMMHDYLLLLQGRIGDNRFEYIYNEIEQELALQVETITTQKM